MCGIFGTTIKNAKSDVALEKLYHRGPDDRGEWGDENILLCQTRLSIIDLSSGGHQPMLSDDGNLVMLFNGEIYNYHDLKNKLISERVFFESQSDTEVILKGFKKYGYEFLSELRGMWSIAIYNKKENTLILSRDQFGIKPLFYSNISGSITFASEIKAITPYLSKVSPNTDNYFLFYNFGYFPGDLTSFNEIKKVLPGEILFINLSNGSFVKKFIDLPHKEISIYNRDEAIELIQDKFFDSVTKHYVSDVPVGLLLSGGNDSAFIAALSREIGKKPTCFNVSIEGSLDNDYAERVASYLQLPFKSVSVKKSIFEEQYDEMWNILDQPTSDTSFIPTSLIYSLIKEQSKVVLSGEGGDEFFGGYERHKKFAQFSEMGFNSFFPDYSSLSKYSLEFVNPIMSRVRNQFNCFESLASLYLYNSRQIDVGIKQKEVLKFMCDYYENHQYKNLIQPNLFFDMFMYLPDNLMSKGDISSMAYGVESRVPFLDKELFAAVSCIDPKLKLSKNFMGKKIMKESMEKYLPKDLIYRKKTGFGINIGIFGGQKIKNDLMKAIKYHQINKDILGIIGSSVESFLIQDNASVILKKFPRFAFAIISNYKIMSQYLK